MRRVEVSRSRQWELNPASRISGTGSSSNNNGVLMRPGFRSAKEARTDARIGDTAHLSAGRSSGEKEKFSETALFQKDRV